MHYLVSLDHILMHYKILLYVSVCMPVSSGLTHWCEEGNTLLNKHFPTLRYYASILTRRNFANMLLISIFSIYVERRFRWSSITCTKEIIYWQLFCACQPFWRCTRQSTSRAIGFSQHRTNIISIHSMFYVRGHGIFVWMFGVWESCI